MIVWPSSFVEESKLLAIDYHGPRFCQTEGQVGFSLEGEQMVLNQEFGCGILSLGRGIQSSKEWLIMSLVSICHCRTKIWFILLISFTFASCLLAKFSFWAFYLVLYMSLVVGLIGIMQTQSAFLLRIVHRCERIQDSFYCSRYVPAPLTQSDFV